MATTFNVVKGGLREGKGKEVSDRAVSVKPVPSYLCENSGEAAESLAG